MKYTELLLVHGGLLSATYSTHQVSAPGIDLLKQRAFEPEERRLSLGTRSNSRSNSVSTSPCRPTSQADTDGNNTNNNAHYDRFGSMDSAESTSSNTDSTADTINGTRYTSPMSTAHNSRSNTINQSTSNNNGNHDEDTAANDERALFDNRSLDLNFSSDLQRRDSPLALPTSSSAMSAAMSGALDEQPRSSSRQEKRSSSLGFNMIRGWSNSANSSRESSRSRPVSWRTKSMK